MAFAIMRCKKIKTGGGVASALQHCFRERQTHNADPERLSENKHGLADNVDTAMGLMRDRLPEKRRKDAVLMVEYMMTASPEWFEKASLEQQKEFFNNSVQWLREKYGKENVIVASIHNDEKTPHLSAFVTPITKDGRLSAKEFIGNRTKMKNDQTSFAQKVAHLGLERGIQGSKAKHRTIQNFYNLVNKAMTFNVITEDSLKPRKLKGKGILKHLPFAMHEETQQAVAERLNNVIQESVAKATKLSDVEARLNQTREVAQKAQKRLMSYEMMFQGLSKEQIDKVKEITQAMKYMNKQEQEKRLKEEQQRRKERRENRKFRI